MFLPVSEYTRWLQSALNELLGLRLPIDGILGPATRGAIRTFQRRWRLPADGFVGPDTERALLRARGGLRPSRTELEIAKPKRGRPEYIQWVQRSLNTLMGLRLAVDGRRGPQTRSAIRRFQQRHGLAADGTVGPQTETALKAALRGQPPGPPPTSPSPAAAAGPPDIVPVRGIRVARRIAPHVDALLAAAAADGIRLSGKGWRSSQTQIDLRRRHCGPTPYDVYERPPSQCTPPTARPGRSLHEQGLAIDFQYDGSLIRSRDNPGFRWLARNAARFGLYNLPSEPWHWSTTGH